MSQDRLIQMKRNQRKNILTVGKYGKMTFDDIKRIERHLRGDIFSDVCCFYMGEIKKNYATISYKNYKVSVQKLLYINYINDLNESDKLILKCENNGICCSLKHIIKK